MKFTFKNAFLISSGQSGTELFNFAFPIKQRQDFQTMLFVIISVLQNPPWSPCLLHLKIWSMFHLMFNKDSPSFIWRSSRWRSTWSDQTSQLCLNVLCCSSIPDHPDSYIYTLCCSPISEVSISFLHLRACLGDPLSFSTSQRFQVVWCSFYLTFMLAAESCQSGLHPVSDQSAL